MVNVVRVAAWTKRRAHVANRQRTKRMYGKCKKDVREMQKGCAYLGCFVFIGVIIGILLALFMILPVPN